MKKFLSGILVVLLIFCAVGCKSVDGNNNNNTSYDASSENMSSATESQTTEEQALEYAKILNPWDYDVLKASKYSFLDIEKIYEEAIIKTSSSLGISTERLYVNIQDRLNDSNVVDYESYMNAYKAYLVKMMHDTEYPEDEATMRNKTEEILAQATMVPISNDSEIIEFKKRIYEECDRISEWLGVDISEYVVFDDITEYKAMLAPEQEFINATSCLGKTSTGWKVIDLSILQSLAAIPEED